MALHSTAKTLYTGIIEPHFRYCCLAWVCSGVTDINQLQKLKNRAARIATGSSFDTPFQSLTKELGWKIIDQLITSESTIMVYNSLHELGPNYMRRGDPLSKLDRKTGQPTSIVCCLLIGS